MLVSFSLLFLLLLLTKEENLVMQCKLFSKLVITQMETEY